MFSQFNLIIGSLDGEQADKASDMKSVDGLLQYLSKSLNVILLKNVACSTIFSGLFSYTQDSAN